MSTVHSQCSIAFFASREDHRLFNKTVKLTKGISDNARKCAKNDWLQHTAKATFALLVFVFFSFFSPSSSSSSSPVREKTFPNRKSRICATYALNSFASFASEFRYVVSQPPLASFSSSSSPMIDATCRRRRRVLRPSSSFILLSSSLLHDDVVSFIVVPLKCGQKCVSQKVTS